MLGISDKSPEAPAWEPWLLCGDLRCPELGWCSLLVLGMPTFLFHMETWILFFLYLNLFCEYGGKVAGRGGRNECACVCTPLLVEGRGQPAGVHSLLPSCRSWGLNPGCQSQLEVSLPSDPSCPPWIYFKECNRINPST